MNSFKEKLLSEKFVQRAVLDMVGKAIMLIMGLIIGYCLKIWLF